MNIQASNHQDISSMPVSEILLKAGFRFKKKCGRIEVFENWSPIALATVKISVDDLLGVWFNHTSKIGGKLIDFIKHWW